MKSFVLGLNIFSFSQVAFWKRDHLNHMRFIKHLPDSLGFAPLWAICWWPTLAHTHTLDTHTRAIERAICHSQQSAPTTHFYSSKVLFLLESTKHQLNLRQLPEFLFALIVPTYKISVIGESSVFAVCKSLTIYSIQRNHSFKYMSPADKRLLKFYRYISGTF